MDYVMMISVIERDHGFCIRWLKNFCQRDDEIGILR